MGDEKTKGGKHAVVRGETGTYTHKANKEAGYHGRHRDGEAPGSSGQNRTTRSDLPHRDGREG